MERSNSQYLPRKQRSKKLETEGNQIKPEQTKLHHQSQQDTEQYQQLCKKTDDLQEGQVLSHYFFKTSSFVVTLFALFNYFSVFNSDYLRSKLYMKIRRN